jgi:predicted Zn finger-like uncharacterized protein
MYTRCANCGTYFRVTREQLQASSGQVRCGRCDSIFDAFAALTSQLPVASSAPASEPEVQADTTTALESESNASAISKTEPPIRNTGLLREPELLTLPDDLFTPGVVIPEPGPRWLWPVASTLLLLVLIAQALFFYGTPLSASLPVLRPILIGACEALGCRIGLARMPEQLFIESSDLQVLDPARLNEIVLTATIRNRAHIAQEFPALELTLTDALNQPAARKVFYPAEYLEDQAGLNEGIAPNEEIVVKLYLDTKDLKPTGYRLYLFFA